jgi:predicted homoserine dehydrogenase-like protein
MIGAALDRTAARATGDALAGDRTFLTGDALALIAADGLEVIVEATGSPAAGVGHALACCRRQRHVVMVNFEADALADRFFLAEPQTQASCTRSLSAISRR